MCSTSGRSESSLRQWVSVRLERAKKFLDNNPFVKLSLYGTAVFMTILAAVDYMVKGKKKAGPRRVTILPFESADSERLYKRDEEVQEMLAAFGKSDWSWEGRVHVVGVDGPRLCGMTELLRQFAQAWQEKEESRT